MHSSPSEMFLVDLCDVKKSAGTTEHDHLLFIECAEDDYRFWYGNWNERNEIRSHKFELRGAITWTSCQRNLLEENGILEIFEWFDDASLRQMRMCRTLQTVQLYKYSFLKKSSKRETGQQQPHPRWMKRRILHSTEQGMKPRLLTRPMRGDRRHVIRGLPLHIRVETSILAHYTSTRARFFLWQRFKSDRDTRWT